MPSRKPDGTEKQAVTPEIAGSVETGRPEDGNTGLPPAGAESEPSAATPEDTSEPVKTVTVDEAIDPAPGAAASDDIASDEVHEEYAEDGHDEGGMSFAAGALGVLLLLLAGAALGIWGAPKLAPLLPSGLAPVAEWLTPGRGETQAEIAVLRARVDDELAGVDARLAELSKAGDDAGDIDARIAAAVGSAETRLAAEIATLQETVDRLDGADLPQRLGTLEATLDGQSAELGTLKEQLTGAAATSGQASDEAVKQIDVYRAELDGLRAEMATLRDTVGALGGRIDQVAAKADRQIETAQSRVSEIRTQADTALGTAEIGAGLAQIGAAISAGQPFEDPIAALATRPDITVPEGLKAAASSGVATMAALRDRFPDAAHQAIRASIMASAGDGVLVRSRAFIEAQFSSRSLTPKQGMDPDAVLSRMEDSLRRDDLKGALAEAEQLPSQATAAMSDWLAAARLRDGALEGLATLDAAVPATN